MSQVEGGRVEGCSQKWTNSDKRGSGQKGIRFTPPHTGLAQGFLVVGVNLHYKNLTITMKQKAKFLCR